MTIEITGCGRTEDDRNMVRYVLGSMLSGACDMLTVCGRDIIYNPNMGSGQYEIYVHDSDHTIYEPCDTSADVMRCIEIW